MKTGLAAFNDGTFGYLLIAVTAAAFARTSLAPVQEAMRTSLHLSDAQIALLQGPALGLPLLAGFMPLGFALDRLSRKHLLILFCTGDLIGTIGSGLTSNFYMLLAFRALIGFCAFATNPTALSIIADQYMSDMRGRATMFTTLGQILGMSAAFAIGGQILAHTGTGLGWSSTLLWIALPIALSVLALIPMKYQISPHKLGLRRSRRDGQHLDGVWLKIVVIVAMAMAEVSFGSVLVWGQPTLLRGFTSSVGSASSVMASALLVSGVIGPVVGGLLADQGQASGGPRRTALLLGLTSLAAVPLALFPFAPSFLSASSALIAFVTVASAFCVMGTSLFTVVVSDAGRGMWMSIFAALSVLFGSALAPVTVAALSKVSPSLNLGASLSCVCAGAMTAAACLLFLSRLSLLSSKRFAVRQN